MSLAPGRARDPSSHPIEPVKPSGEKEHPWQVDGITGATISSGPSPNILRAARRAGCRWALRRSGAVSARLPTAFPTGAAPSGWTMSPSDRPRRPRPPTDEFSRGCGGRTRSSCRCWACAPCWRSPTARNALAMGLATSSCSWLSNVVISVTAPTSSPGGADRHLHPGDRHLRHRGGLPDPGRQSGPPRALGAFHLADRGQLPDPGARGGLRLEATGVGALAGWTAWAWGWASPSPCFCLGAVREILGNGTLFGVAAVPRGLPALGGDDPARAAASSPWRAGCCSSTWLRGVGSAEGGRERRRRRRR